MLSSSDLDWRKASMSSSDEESASERTFGSVPCVKKQMLSAYWTLVTLFKQ